MDLVKQYIIQSISAASNNLRLSTEKIEVVALLRETISNSRDLPEDIKKMKKVTEFSTLAIRLNQIYNYLTEGRIDFFKLSDQFKEHSQYLIKDLNHLLEMVNSVTFKESIKKIYGEEENQEAENISMQIDQPVAGQMNNEEEIAIDLSDRKPDENVFEISESDKIKEELILNDEKEEGGNSFEDYESGVLTHIKSIDALLKSLSLNKITAEEIDKYIIIMRENAKSSEKKGFNIIGDMHKILSNCLLLLKNKVLDPSKELIESMRACLIVIVAVVRGKEVDITNYLNRAEELGKKINNYKIEDYN
jgi:hypothetical protein